MKTNKIIFKISFFISIVSLISYVAFYLVNKNGIWQDISLAFFGSTIFTVFTSLITYFNSKDTIKRNIAILSFDFNLSNIILANEDCDNIFELDSAIIQIDLMIKYSDKLILLLRDYIRGCFIKGKKIQLAIETLTKTAKQLYEFNLYINSDKINTVYFNKKIQEISQSIDIARNQIFIFACSNS